MLVITKKDMNLIVVKLISINLLAFTCKCCNLIG